MTQHLAIFRALIKFLLVGRDLFFSFKGKCFHSKEERLISSFTRPSSFSTSRALAFSFGRSLLLSFRRIYQKRQEGSSMKPNS